MCGVVGEVDEGGGLGLGGKLAVKMVKLLSKWVV